MTTRTSRTIPALMALCLTACSLLPEAAPTPRYFLPTYPTDLPPVQAGDRSGTPLRLRAVTAVDHLDARVTWARGPSEMGFYELLRWSDRPDTFVGQALAYELFELAGLQRVTRGDAPTLDVRVWAFEERLDPEHVARVALEVKLVDGQRRGLLTTVIQGTHPIANPGPDDIAAAMGQAMAEAVRETVTAVIAALPPAGAAQASASGGDPPLLVASDLDNRPFRLGAGRR